MLCCALVVFTTKTLKKSSFERRKDSGSFQENLLIDQLFLYPNNYLTK